MIVRAVPRGEERSKMLKRSFWDRYAGVYDLVTRPGNKELAEAAAWIAGFLRPRDRLLEAFNPTWIQNGGTVVLAA